MDLTPAQLRTASILMPNAMQRHDCALADNLRFVHYTSAEVAVKILKSKEIWMRKSSCMNDFMEVQHGLQCLWTTYNKTEIGERFKTALNRAYDGIAAEIELLFNSWTPTIQTDTFIACISEHDASEDIISRLSMWRAYSGTAGVAFVLNNKPFLSPSDALGAYTSPVAYLDLPSFQNEFEKVVKNIEAEITFLQSIGRELFKASIFHVLRSAALCTKHPGFQEEREWRVVFSPRLAPSSPLIRDLVVVKGVPQPIYRIPLKNIPEQGFEGAEIPELVDRLIIGPSQHPFETREAFIELLVQNGVKNADEKVVCSDIPLRI